jgi:hypothetical protein
MVDRSPHHRLTTHQCTITLLENSSSQTRSEYRAAPSGCPYSLNQDDKVKIAMKKMFCLPTIDAFALAVAVFLSYPANAQQSISSHHDSPRHLASDAMGVADNAALHAHQSDLIEAARIYGYTLEAGNWKYEQTLCAPMPDTILLHYLQQFPDGTESLFTALVPRGVGRIRVVPVLYHSATPYVPAPRNPRNFALFNELVPGAIAAQAVAPNGNAVELSVCYAELTGGRTNVPPGSGVRVAISGAPLATTHVNAQDKAIRVTFADREGARTYKIWTVSLDQNGRVHSVETENESVYAANSTSPQTQPVPMTEMTKTDQSEQSNDQAEQTESQQPSTVDAANQPAHIIMDAGQAAPVSAAPAAPLTVVPGSESSSESGWKFVLHPAEPSSKIVASAPQPPEKLISVPADPENQIASENQSPR